MRTIVLTLLILLLTAPALAQSIAFADLPPRVQTLLTVQFDAENAPVDHDDDPTTPEQPTFATINRWFIVRTRAFWRGQADYQRTLRRRERCASVTQAERDAFESTNGFDPCAGG